MAKYISKEDILRLLTSSPVWTGLDAISRVNTMPSIDLADYVPKDFHDKTCEAMAKRHQEEIADILERADADRPQGEWIYTDNPLRLDDEWACSRCGNISFMRTNFCDRCGARMLKGADDETD